MSILEHYFQSTIICKRLNLETKHLSTGEWIINCGNMPIQYDTIQQQKRMNY